MLTVMLIVHTMLYVAARLQNKKTFRLQLNNTLLTKGLITLQ